MSGCGCSSNEGGRGICFAAPTKFEAHERPEATTVLIGEDRNCTCDLRHVFPALYY
jgi:hypothetical protein